MRAGFHQGQKPDGGKGAVAVRSNLEAECLPVLFFIGEIHRAPVQAYQTPLPVPGPLGGLGRNGFHYFIVELPYHFPTQSLPGLADAGWCDDPRCRKFAFQPLEALEQAAEYLPVRDIGV